MVRQRKSKELAKFELECLLPIFIYSNSKFKATCKSVAFECRYIRTHTKEKPSKISNITFAILPSYQKKKILKLNGHSEYFGIYFSWWNHQMHLKMVHFNIKSQNLELVILKCLTYAQPIPLSLNGNIITSVIWCGWYKMLLSIDKANHVTIFFFFFFNKLVPG